MKDPANPEVSAYYPSLLVLPAYVSTYLAREPDQSLGLLRYPFKSTSLSHRFDWALKICFMNLTSRRLRLFLPINLQLHTWMHWDWDRKTSKQLISPARWKHEPKADTQVYSHTQDFWSRTRVLLPSKYMLLAEQHIPCMVLQAQQLPHVGDLWTQPLQIAFEQVRFFWTGLIPVHQQGLIFRFSEASIPISKHDESKATNLHLRLFQKLLNSTF